MNPPRPFLSLLRFTLSSIPVVLWVLAAHTLVLAIMFTKMNVVIDRPSGFYTLKGTFMLGLILPMVIAVPFLCGPVPGGETRSGAPAIPYGEFLLTRPILRKQAYQPRILLYFILVLATPVVQLALYSGRPDMLLSLPMGLPGNTESAVTISRYQAVFPKSRVIHKKVEHRETLIVPHGYIAVAAWETFVAILLALAMQIVPLLNFKKRAVFVAAIILVVLSSLCAPFSGSAQIVERGFLFFVTHRLLFAGLTLVLAVWVQCFAARRAQEMEVI